MTVSSCFRRRVLQRLGVTGLAAAALSAAPTALGQYSLTVLHNNDGESQLINAGAGLEEFGGVARFKTLVDNTRSFYQGQGHGVLTISSGDNFLPRAEFEASMQSGAPGSRDFYDAFAISEIGYDAVILGNHDFDFGPDVLAEFIGDAQTTNATQYLSANLDFSATPSLNALGASVLAPSTIVSVNTGVGVKNVGIIGATTENLPFISSPGAVGVNDVATAVNAQIASLQGSGVDHIILASHLQGVSEEVSLVSQLNAGVDLVIAGGGDDLLGDLAAPSPVSGAPASIADTGFIPGDSSGGDYPITTATDLGGNFVPVVATDANYKYLGRITLNFDAAGALLGVAPDSNPQRVASTTADAVNGVAADATVQANSVNPVAAFLADLETTLVGTTSQTLIQGGSDGIRSEEKAVGNLVADAYLEAAVDRAMDFGVDTPTVALVNGGGIRADIGAGDISVKDTFDVSPFSNFVSVIEDVTADDFKMLLENAYSRTVDADAGAGIDPERQGDGTGRFAQVSGFSVVYDITEQALELDGDGNIVTAGSRIIDVIIDDGTEIVKDGVVTFAGTLDVATAAFLATGGDQYFDEDYLSQAYAFTTVGITDQQALAGYIEGFNGADLAGDTRYDNIADGRIVAIPEPTTAGLVALGGLGLLARRRQQG
ncbi:MAG: 5'-nucleotidase C-terminal domain-containing protein [Planctomycetota bacterium]